MRTRALLMAATIAVAVIAVACGRASESEINQALGITPTATQSAGQIATSTAQAIAQATERAAAAATPGGGEDLAVLGNVSRGKQTAQFRCLGCHRADGSGQAPPLFGPGNPAEALTDQQIKTMIREGTDHDPPGAFETFEISDTSINDILAYLRSGQP